MGLFDARTHEALLVLHGHKGGITQVGGWMVDAVINRWRNSRRCGGGPCLRRPISMARRDAVARTDALAIHVLQRLR